MAPIPNTYNNNNTNNTNNNIINKSMYNRNVLSNLAIQDISVCYDNESILHRLERGGRVPSADKFRRMGDSYSILFLLTLLI